MGLQEKVSKLTSSKPLWFETAFSMPMSSNTYVRINMTQKVEKNDESGGMLGSVIVLAKNCPLLQFEVSDIKTVHKRDKVQGRGIPKGTYVEDILDNKVYLKNDDLDLQVFCSRDMIENITEFNICGSENSTLELALHYRPLKKKEKF